VSRSSSFVVVSVAFCCVLFTVDDDDDDVVVVAVAVDGLVVDVAVFAVVEPFFFGFYKGIVVDFSMRLCLSPRT